MKSDLVKLQLALQEILFLLENVAHLPEEELYNDPIIQRAAVLSLIVIGEETNKLSPGIKMKYKEIPWNLLKGMRNRMVHNYDGIDTDLVLNTIRKDIPLLKFQLEKMLLDEDFNDESIKS